MRKHEAVLKATGNQAAGYSLDIVLPQEWLNNFATSSCFSVAGTPLSRSWGEMATRPSSDIDSPYHVVRAIKITDIATIVELNNKIEEIKNRLAAANKATKIDTVNKEIIISLD